MPTVAEYYQNIGRVEGQHLAKQTVARELIEDGFDDAKIAQYTNLPISDIGILRQSVSQFHMSVKPASIRPS